MFKIPKQLVEEIIAHARESYPKEACGILAGKNSIPSHIYRVKNVDPNPQVRYLMDTQEQFWIFKNMRHNGLELVAIYHSHPVTQPYPSETDKRLAFYPEAHYLLTTLRDPQNPPLHAYRILDGNVTEEPIQIT